MPARTCARALTQKRAEEISAPHPRARTHARAQPSRIHHKTRMVSPPRCPNRHMATGGLPPTIHLTRATAPGPAHRQYHHPTARASTGRLTRRAPRPATPAPAGHPSGRQAAACRRQSGQRTHPRSHARRPPPHTRKHMCLRVPLSRVLGTAGGGAAGTGARPGAGAGAHTTNANRKHRHVRRPKHAAWRSLCQGSRLSRSFCEFARLPSPVACNVYIFPRTGVADTCQTHYGQTGPTLHA